MKLERIPPTSYAGAAVIKRAIAAARKAGLDPAGFDLLPDGTIRIMEAHAVPQPASLFDQLQEAGKL